ncbi:MAG: hypothetical protein ACEPOW_13045 [Bacteroidales bacterium]
MKYFKFVLICFITFVLIYFIAFKKPFEQTLQFTEENITETFQTVKSICDKDNGKLWGKNLWGPILVIDKKTRQVYANQQDKNIKLAKVGNIYTGTFPTSKVIANSTTHFEGTFWTQVADLPTNDLARNTLFIHEIFHRLQPELGLDCNNYSNNHMEKNKARLLLKLEWAALEAAIDDHNKAMPSHILDALIFRNYRRELFIGADTMENRFEIHEGFPEYTAYKLCSNSLKELKKHLKGKKENYWAKENFVRSFGYYSGFLYAYLLDLTSLDWKKNINANDDLGEILRNSLDLKLPDDLEVAYNTAKYRYDFSNIYNDELLISQRKDSLHAAWHNIFSHNPTLNIPLQKPNIGFNPLNLTSIDSLGTVYDFIKITDNWGRLDVYKGGCLLDNNWQNAKIPVKSISLDSNLVRGSSWELKLKEGWQLKKVDTNYSIIFIGNSSVNANQQCPKKKE